MRADTGYSKGVYFKVTCEKVGLFYKKEGRWPFRLSKDKEEKRLADWCHKIRLKFRQGQLDDNSLRLLEGINFSFGPHQELWARSICELKEYFDRDELPPYKSNLRLFAYRHYYYFDKLPKSKQEQLNSIRFLENYRRLSVDNEDIWQRNFLATVNFFLAYNKLPNRTASPALEGWLTKQRRLLKKGLLSEAHSRLFKEAGIDLSEGSFSKTPWDEKYERYKNFVLANQCFPTPSLDKELYSWMQVQKQKYRNGKLGEQQIQKLRAIGCRLEPTRKTGRHAIRA